MSGRRPGLVNGMGAAPSMIPFFPTHRYANMDIKQLKSFLTITPGTETDPRVMAAYFFGITIVMGIAAFILQLLLWIFGVDAFRMNAVMGTALGGGIVLAAGRIRAKQGVPSSKRTLLFASAYFVLANIVLLWVFSLIGTLLRMNFFGMPRLSFTEYVTVPLFVLLLLTPLVFGIAWVGESMHREKRA